MKWALSPPSRRGGGGEYCFLTIIAWKYRNKNDDLIVIADVKCVELGVGGYSNSDTATLGKSKMWGRQDISKNIDWDGCWV